MAVKQSRYQTSADRIDSSEVRIPENQVDNDKAQKTFDRSTLNEETRNPEKIRLKYPECTRDVYPKMKVTELPLGSKTS